jgi:hypothetical protein
MTVQTAEEFVWTFPAGDDSAFVLHAHGRAIGRLQFAKEPGGHSTAEWDGRRWIFERQGHSVTVRAEGSEEAAAVFTPTPTGGGIAVLANGARYCWAREHIWSPVWCFHGKESRSAVCVAQQAGPLAAGGKAVICAEAAKSPDTPILVLLAWYLRVLEFQKLSECLFLCG